MTIIHKIKLEDKYALPVSNSRKRFEIRLNDRNYKVGDRIRFLFFSDLSRGWRAGDRWPDFEITYILEEFVGLADGYIAFSIEKVSEVTNG